MTIAKQGLSLFKVSPQVLKGHNEISSKNQETFKDLINKGYDIPRYKYNIILTPRIKYSSKIIDDLGFDKPGCYLYLLIGTKSWIENELVKQEEYKLKNGSLKGYKWWNSNDIDCLKPTICDDTWKYTDDMVDRTIATIGIKPTKELASSSGTTLELTAFTSHMKSSGELMIELLIKDLKSLNFEEITHKKVTRLVASVIQEHDLVGYYTKVLHFIEVNSILVNKHNEDGILESGVEASQDFHIIGLYKDLQ